MVADSKGNDIGAVGIPISGVAGIAPLDEDNILTPVQGADPALVLSSAFRKLGLFKTDGGFNWTGAAAGEPLEFFQVGYSIPNGDADATVQIGLAQMDALVRELQDGKAPDVNGYKNVDVSGNAENYLLYTEEIYKNGWIRRRLGATRVTAFEEDQRTRAAVAGSNVTFTYDPSDFFEGGHYGEWLIDGNAPPLAPTITAATPTGAEQNELVHITGTGFAGVTGAAGVKFGAVNASSYEVFSPTTILAVVPAGASGSAPITVTNSTGTSAAFAYTRG